MDTRSSYKKNVLLVVRWPVGGIRTFIRYVYHNFHYDNWQITILTPDGSETRTLIDDLSGLDVRFVLTKENASLLSLTLKVVGELWCNQYNLLHSHGFTAAMISALPVFLYRLPHIMTSHETLHDNQFLGLKGKTKRILMAGLFRFIQKVHSVSHDAQENLVHFFPSLGRTPGKCITISNGIDVQIFNEASPRNLRSELGIGNGVFLIGFLGRFMPPKGFHYLIEAIDLLRRESGLPKQFLVLAFGYGGFIREENQAIQEKGLNGYFRFMPFAPNVAETLKGLDVVTMPSLWEACGLLAMEAMVCGTPLIGTDCIGLREVLRDTPARIVPKADSVALARALQKEMAISSKDTFMAFRDEAVKRFDVAVARQRLAELYQLVVR